MGEGDQTSQGRGQLSLATVLQESDGFLQWGLVGIRRPGPVIGRRVFSTRSAQVFGTMSQCVRRRKGMRTARATRREDRGNLVPAALAKKGNGVVIQGMVARPAIHGKHGMEESANQSGSHMFRGPGCGRYALVPTEMTLHSVRPRCWVFPSCVIRNRHDKVAVTRSRCREGYRCL